MNPLLIAIIIGWIMSVCLHEYAHALAAYLAGDRSVRDRGYLTMNPLLYIDPINSLLIPAVILWWGGVPLPGGAVLVDRSALPKKWQASMVSAAGPATNLLLFLVLSAIIHPRVGLVPDQDVETWPMWAVFVGAMALLQILSVLLNLVPIPPLDGFGMIEPHLSPSTRQQILASRIPSMGVFILFAAFFFIPQVSNVFFHIVFRAFAMIGIPPEVPMTCYDMVFSGKWG